MTSGNWLEEKAFPPDPIFHFGLLSLSFLIVRIYTFYTEGYTAIFKTWRKELLCFFLISVRPCVSFEFIESIIFAFSSVDFPW